MPISGSATDSVNTVALTALDESSIVAKIVGGAAAVAGSGDVGVSGAIGAALARNLIGWELDGNGDAVAVSGAGQVQAYVEDSSIFARGALSQQAIAQRSIDDLVLSFAVGIGVGGAGGVSGAGSGTSAENRIGGNIGAYIKGDGPVGITTSSIALTADDRSQIKSNVAAAALTVAGGGTFGGAVSIGVALSENYITTAVEAYVKDADDVTVTSGDLTVSAKTGTLPIFTVTNNIATIQSGLDQNIVQNNTLTNTLPAELRTAFGNSGINLSNTLAVSVLTMGEEWLVRDIDNKEAYIVKLSSNVLTVSQAAIDAVAVAAAVAASGSGGIKGGISGAGALANNIIRSKTKAYLENSNIQRANNVELSAQSSGGIVSTIVSASLAGAVGIGGGGALSIGAGFAKNVIGTRDAIANPNDAAEVKAYSQNTHINASDDISIAARSTQSIGSVVVAGSVAISGGGIAALSGAGAGTQVENQIFGAVEAYIDGDGANGIQADRLSLSADDLSTIKAIAVAAALAISVAPTPSGVGVSVAIAATIANNEIGNFVNASIRNASNVTASAGNASLAGIAIAAQQAADIDSVAVSAAIAAAVAPIGISFSGAGTSAMNTITSVINASIEDSVSVTSGGAIDITADSDSSISSRIAAAALSASLVAAAGGVTISKNTISDTVTAKVTDTTLKANVGDIAIAASSTPTTDTVAVAVALAAGIGASAAVVTAQEDIESNVNAFVDSSDLTASQGNLRVEATSEASVDPDVVGASVGAVSVGVIDYVANISGSTNAYVTGANRTSAAGKIDILATDVSTASPNITQVSVGLLTVGTINVTPTISRTTQAYVGENAQLTAANHDINIKANTESTLTNNISQVSVGAVTIGVLNMGGTISANTLAYVAKGADVAGKNVTVEADATPYLEANVDQVSVSLVNVGAMSVKNNLQGSVEAYTDENAVVTATNLTVDAEMHVAANRQHSVFTDLFYVGVGLGVDVATATSEANISTSVKAFVGPRDNATLAPGDQAIAVADTLTIRALATEIAEAKLTGGSGSLIANGNNFTPKAAITGNVEAYVGSNAQINARNLNVTTEKANAKTRREVTADLFAASIGGLGSGSNSGSTATITGNVEATIRDGAKINVNNDGPLGTVTVKADSIAKTDAIARGGNGSVGISVSLFEARSVIGDGTNGNTAAWIGDAEINTNNLAVEAIANNKATADVLAVSIGLVGGGGRGESIALMNANTDASLQGSNLDATGNVSISANSTAETQSKVRSGAGSIIVGAISSQAKADTRGNTRAYVDDGTTIDNAQQVDVEAAVVGATANANINVGSGAAVSIGVAKADADSAHIAKAYVGKSARIGQTSPIGSLAINATGRGEADAASNASGGGAVQVGTSLSEADYNPTVEAYIDTGTVIDATGDVSVNALLDNQPSAQAPSNEITGVDAANNTINFTFPVNDGDVVRYVVNSGSQIGGGLQNGREYGVLVDQADVSIKLGNRFDATKVVANTDVITFEGNHNFQNGDAAGNSPDSGVPIIEPGQGISSGQTLYVRLIQIDQEPNGTPIYDPFSIRLVDNRAQALASDSALLSTFQVGAINSNTNRFTQSGQFAEGDTVTYSVPVAPIFFGVQVDVPPNGTSYDNLRDQDSPGANNIFILNHGLQSGDFVTYKNNGNTAEDSGLSNGAGYRVIRTNSNSVQLTQAYADVSAGQISTIDIDPDPNERTDISQINLGNHSFTNGQRLTDLNSGNVYFVSSRTQDTFRLSRSAGGAPVLLPGGSNLRLIGEEIAIAPAVEDGEYSLEKGIQGLENGQTYYVKNVSGQTFQLATDSAGTNIVDFSVNPSTTSVQLGNLGLDLKPGSEQQTLTFDLQNAYTDPTPNPGTIEHMFMGAGGSSLSTVSPASGDGVSGASATGGGGGVVEVGTPTARMNSTSQVTAHVSATSITADGSVSIDADANSRVTSYARNGGGGGDSIGDANATTNSTANTDAYVGSNVDISAGNDFILQTDSNHFVGSESRSTGGGAIASKRADTGATLNYTNKSEIRSGATITALDAVGIYANSAADGATTAFTESGGAGSGSVSNSTLNIGGSTQNEVDQAVDITADSVDINAQVDKLNGTSNSTARTYAFVAVADADSGVNLTSTVGNVIGVDGDDAAARTTITGSRGVDITAVAADLLSNRNRSVLPIGFIPVPRGGTQGGDNSTETIDVKRNVEVVAGVRDESRANGGGAAEISSGNSGLQKGSAITSYANKATPSLALYVDVRSGQDDSNELKWDADVTILSGGGEPELVIDQDGKIIKLTNVSVRDDRGDATELRAGDTISDGDYFVEVSNSGALGDAFFKAEQFVKNGIASPSNPSWPLFEFRNNFGNIDILDHSDQEMHIVKIDTINRGDELPLVQIESAPGAPRSSTTLEFDLRRAFAATEIDIQKIQRDRANLIRSDRDIVIDGDILNPIGFTRILNTDGNILASTPTAWIETSALDIEAINGSVGLNDANRVNVALVRGIDLGDVGNANDDAPRATTLYGAAQNDVYLNLKGIDRIPLDSSLQEPFIVSIDAIESRAGDVNLLLQDSEHQTGTGQLGGVRVFVPTETPVFDEILNNHFRPDVILPNAVDPAVLGGGTVTPIDSA